MTKSLSPMSHVAPLRPEFMALKLMLSAIAFVAFADAGAQDPVTVRAVLRDSLSGRPVDEGLVALRNVKVDKSQRVNRDGQAVFTRVANGAYYLTIIRMGYKPRAMDIIVAGHDTTVVVTMVPIPAELAQVQVRSNTQEVFGIVGGMPQLNAVVGAKVLLAGTRRTTTTDSAGKFLFDNLKPGQYVLRISANGFADRMVTIVLPRGKAVESSHLLDPGRTNTAISGELRDMETRIATRGFNSAVISGDELQTRGNSMSTALQASQDVAAKGLQITGAICVFLNGRPMPGWPVDGLNPEDVAFVEVYGDKGDATSSLKNRWPQNQRCTEVSGPRRTVSPKAAVRYVSVWTKR